MSNNLKLHNTSRPFFSVVIPVYNKEPHIARSISSVLNQSFTNFELLIICDPSTDNSNYEVEKFKDPRIRIIYRDKPGPGGYAARNVGIKNAKSDWIAFLDADDEWYPQHLVNLYKAHQKHPEQAVISCGWKVYEHEKLRIDNYSKNRKLKSSHTINFKDYLVSETTLGRPIWTSVACIKKQILINVGLFPEGKISMGGDVDTWLRCVEESGSLFWSEHIGAIYYTDSVNMVTKNSIISPDLHTSTLENMLSKGYSEDINNLLMIRYNNLLTFAWNQNMHRAIKYNFEISKLIFFKAQPLKSGFYITFSLLPFSVSKPLHSFLYRIIKVKRKLTSKLKD